MTNKEAVKALIGFDIPDSVLEARAELLGIDLSANYDPTKSKVIARFSANLLFYVAQQPQSIREIDWAITNYSLKDLLALRSAILQEAGISDSIGKPTIRARVWG